MAVCMTASLTLLSVGICQSRGLGCDFPPLGSCLEDLICRLYMMNSEGIREEIHELEMNKQMELYYVDIISITSLNSIPYVSQHGNYIESDALLGGSLGVVCHRHSFSEEVCGEVCGIACARRQEGIDENAQPLVGTEAVAAF